MSQLPVKEHQYIQTMQEFNDLTHRRFNILTGEWVLVSPHRTKRPWQGRNEEFIEFPKITYDKNCYLCPGNTRANGEENPFYKKPFAFTNDFSALLENIPRHIYKNGLLRGDSETGICRVVCFSPHHSMTLSLMNIKDIEEVINVWIKEFRWLGQKDDINYVQIFENKGSVMGCSNPHPHGQIWAQFSIPEEIKKKTKHQKEYWETHRKSLLFAYLEQELELKERIIFEDDHFAVLVPYWAIWPYEAMILPKRKVATIDQLTRDEIASFAKSIKKLTTKYDNIFKTSFPYSAGIHQAPTNGNVHEEWHMHMSFYPPLLRSSTVKKFMVGYEMFAAPQRDITAEQAAQTIREQSEVHYSNSL